MNSVYNHILLQNLKNLPKHGQDLNEQFEKAFGSYLSERVLSKTIGLLESLQGTTEDVIKSVTVLEARALGLQKAFNLTTDVSRQQAIVLDNIAAGLNINARLAKQYTAENAKFLPGQIKNINANEKYNKELQLTNDFLRNRLGLDAQQAFSIRKLANLQGKSVAEVIKDAQGINEQLIEETGYSGGLVDILSEIANLNSDIAIQYGRDVPGSLEKSVISAKKFGITLNDLYKTGEKMLDVENATNSAVEYQIFTGKRLEGQKYKNIAASYNQATIEGDSEKQMDIILDLVTAQGETLKTNFKAREAVSKMTGIEASKLIDIIALQEEYNKLGTEAGEGGVAGTSEGISQTLIDEIKAITEKVTTQTTIERFDDAQEIRKANLAVEAAPDAPTQAKVLETANNLMNTFADSISGDGIAVPAIKAASVFADVLYIKETGEKLVKTLKEKDSAFESESPEIVTSDAAKDAFIRVNDAILFDPNDKINIMASTSQASLDKTTANMAGGSSNNTSNIGQQVANAISGMSFVVNNTFNGEEIITAMEIIQGNKMNA